MQKIKLQITGIHCKSCKTLIEEEVSLIAGVKEVEVNAKTSQAWVVYNEGETTKDEIIKAIEHLNYEAKVIKTFRAKDNSPEDKKQSESSGASTKNLLISAVVLVLLSLAYLLASRFGLFEFMEKLNESNLSYGLIFVIGLLASFHCIGMCGGIVIAYTTRFCPSVKGNNNISFPHIYYNIGRIAAYALTGAVLGGVGSFFGISPTFTSILTLLAGLFMVAVGLSLIVRLSILDKITGILPISFMRLFSKQIHSLKPKAPVIIGFLNGFIPCGPLQAMQIYSLASGSALAGGLSMAAFGLGTAPLMLGFGNIISILSHSRIKQIMKISGAIVMILGILNISRSYAIYKNDSSSSLINNSQTEETVAGTDKTNTFQEARMNLTYKGYEPSTLTVKKGVPVRWIINVKEMSGCTSEILLPAFNVDKNLKKGENIIEFTPKVAGTYKFSCGMQMVWGKFIVE